MADYEFDVAISYSGSERAYVTRVVKRLRLDGVRVFFDRDVQEELIGEDLMEVLVPVYRDKCRFIAMFISPGYLEGDWTQQEAAVALCRQRGEDRRVIIPVRFDGAVLSGLDPDIVYLNGSAQKEAEVAYYIREKVMRARREQPEPQQQERADSGQPPKSGERLRVKAKHVSIVEARDIRDSQIQCTQIIKAQPEDER